MGQKGRHITQTVECRASGTAKKVITPGKYGLKRGGRKQQDGVSFPPRRGKIKFDQSSPSHLSPVCLKGLFDERKGYLDRGRLGNTVTKDNKARLSRGKLGRLVGRILPALLIFSGHCWSTRTPGRKTHHFFFY